MSTITSINPTNNKPLQTYSLHTEKEIDTAIIKGHETFKHFRKTTFQYRAQLIKKVANLLEEKKKTLALDITQEMGKPLQAAIAEIEKCAWVCRYYAENAEKFLADQNTPTEAQKSYVTHQPLGLILAVMPWNYPYWQVFRFAAPALIAGNTAILKHASNVPACALAIANVFKEAGFEEGVFQSLLISSKQVPQIIKHKNIVAATLTGSFHAGSSVAALAGQNIKKTVLELGGSDPYIILKDADLDLAVEHCVTSRLLNAGQSCIGAKRFIVVDEIYDEFIKNFKSKMSQATFGDPLKQVKLGPMARTDLRNELHHQVLKSVEQGAKLSLGGVIPELNGAYYPPTILEDVKPGVLAYHEELFGPVASVIRVNNETEAIEVANDTSFGLGACVFTKNIERGEQIARNELEAGCCFVNQFVKSDPRLPFGGIKESGYGRELSDLGIKEFVNIKTVWIA